MTWEDKYKDEGARPPKSADMFLEWYCSDDYFEEVKGDLQELYNNNLVGKNKIVRWLLYWWNVIRFFRPYLLRKKILHVNIGGPFMFKSYLKIAFRNLRKQAFYSIINITGLVVGIVCVLFLTLFVNDELSYDDFNEKGDRTYRLVTDFLIRGNVFQSAMTGGPVGEGMLREFPEIEQQTRIRPGYNVFVRYNTNTYKENKIYYVDSTFFDVFSIGIKAGNKETALAAPNSIMLSEKYALKYFGNENPIGKTLIFNNRTEYYVTGVFKNFPNNSHFQTDMLASLCTHSISTEDQWTNSNFHTYVVLNKEANVADIQKKFNILHEKYVIPEINALTGMNISSLEDMNVKCEWIFQPIKDIHLYSNYQHEIEINSDIQYVYIFSAIGLFILLLACINFINLATARSSLRAKEVGIKKVVGSNRKSLILQFLTESVTISLIALIFALLALYLLLPSFNFLSGKDISYTQTFNGTTIVFIILIPFITGVLAGAFPAFVISKFNPAVILKGNVTSGVKKGWLRSGLVIFQFTTSIILIISTFIVHNQLSYIQNKKLGFNKEHVLIINDTFILDDRAEVFKQEVFKNPNVICGSMSGFLPITSNRSKNGTAPDANLESDKFQPIETFRVDTEYIRTMGLNLVQGRNFSIDHPTDSMAAIINQACAKLFGWDNPLDHSVGRYVAGTPPYMAEFKVIGVIEDFHFESLKNKIEPVILYLKKSSGNISFRLNTNNVAGVIDHIKDVWQSYVPGQPFSYRFMDEGFNDMYKAELKIGEIFNVFALLAIIVGCLGLFGLSAFTAERKTKEIGIRKVHGATVKNVVILLSKEFAKLILISFIIAAPIAYYLMSGWLQNYAYRTELNLWTFFISGLLAMAIALITVSYHAVKAGLLNPSVSLKCE